MLYIVATPIGNLEDITFRAVRILKEVAVIAAEDTRHSHILLKHYGIETQVISFHSYSDERRVNEIIARLIKGEDVALISDAGTPGISDPGFKLIVKAREVGITVIPVPGPTALITALQASGLATHRFSYYGFLPLKKGRKRMIQGIAQDDGTAVIYEAPHRMEKLLREMMEVMPDRKLVVARELTKKFEEYSFGTAVELLDKFGKGRAKGEFVVLVGGAE